MSESPDGAPSPTLPPPVAVRPVAVRMLAAFGRFWWEFFVGDTPELFVGTVFIVGVVAVLCHRDVRDAVVVVALPVLTAGLLGLSVRRAARRARPGAVPDPAPAAGPAGPAGPDRAA